MPNYKPRYRVTTYKRNFCAPFAYSFVAGLWLNENNRNVNFVIKHLDMFFICKRIKWYEKRIN